MRSPHLSCLTGVRKLPVILALVLTTVVLSNPTFGDIIPAGTLFATGILRADDLELTNSDDPNDPYASLESWEGASLEWWVYEDAVKGQYTYKYTFNKAASASDLSHFAVEATFGLSPSEVLAGTTTGWELGYDRGQAPSGIDGSSGKDSVLWGLKWDVPPEVKNVASYTYMIVTARIPVWGDVFLKDGNISAVNSGYWASDPPGNLPAPPSDPRWDWVAVPDSQSYKPPAVPEPNMMIALIGMGLMGGGIRIARRRRG